MGMLVQWDVTRNSWASRTDTSVNPLASDEYKYCISPKGELVVLNGVSKNMQGGLISCNVPFPTFFKPTFFGFDVFWNETAEDLPYKPRNEMDLKITTPDAGGPQANGSCQWNKDAKCWDLDPTGKTWVHTSFNKEPVVGPNHFGIRVAFDGKVWSVTAINLNGIIHNPDPSKFANLPALQSGWGNGLHPQLQTEALAPFFLRTIYTEVLVSASDAEIAQYA
jgi:hypothetical protein